MPSVDRRSCALPKLLAWGLLAVVLRSPGGPSARAADIWLVSTRGVHSARQAAVCPGTMQAYVAGRWSAVPPDLWHSAGSAERPLVVYVHGNHRDESGAQAEGLLVRERIAASLPAECAFDFLIWSWPSQELPVSVLHDVRVKERRTVLEAQLLAQWLHEHAAGRPQSLVGYSFGSAVISGALQALADRTPERDSRGPRRAVLIGAAAGADWWSPEGRHRLALTQVDRMTVLINPQDWVLQLYPLVFRGRGPAALGAVGPSPDARWHPQAGEIEVLELPRRGLAAHDLPQYLSQAEFDCTRWPLALFAELPGLSDASTPWK